MKSNLKRFLFNKPVSCLGNNTRIDYTEITQLKKKYMMEAEIKTKVTELQQHKVIKINLILLHFCYMQAVRKLVFNSVI